MKLIYYTLAIFLPISIACTPKIVATTQQELEEAPQVISEDKDENCLQLSDLSIITRDEAETAFVLYKDFLKSEDYDQAYAYWKRAYELAPASNGSIQYHYDDGIKIYRHQYSQATDAASKIDIVDKVRGLYDKRRECFGDEVYLNGREGFDLYYYFPEEVEDQEVYNLFKSVIDVKGDDADYFIMNPMAKILSDKAIAEDITPSEAGMYAKKMLSAIKKGTDNCTSDCESWNVINSYAPARLENLEGIKGLYDCSYYADKYYPMFQADPTSCETINLVNGRMKWGGCEDSNPMIQEIASAKATHCKLKVVASAPGPLRQAFDLYESGQYTEAVTAFEDFANSTTDIDKKAKYLMLVAKIYYRDIKKFSKARTFAEKAASVKPNWGEPYMLIGKLYASSGPLCGPGTGFDSQVVTWPAIDMFTKAKQVDPSVANDANKLIATYEKYMPSKEDIFSRTIKAGNTYKVKCWINRNTIVRTAD